MSVFLKHFLLQIQNLSLDQWGLILNFVGGLMMAIDLAGRDRVDKLERFVQNRFASKKVSTGFMIHMTQRMFWGARASGGIVLWVLFFPVAILLCRIILPLTGASGFFHTLVFELWGVLYVLLEFIVQVILLTLVLFIALLVILWGFSIAVWILLSPLFIGRYLKERHGFGGAVPLAGVILVTVGFLFQLIASFRR
jgi:hypothetical protein